MGAMMPAAESAFCAPRVFNKENVMRVDEEMSFRKEMQKKIEELRFPLNKSQAARKAAMPQSQWHNMETGVSVPNTSTLRKLADAFGKKLVIEFVDDDFLDL